MVTELKLDIDYPNVFITTLERIDKVIDMLGLEKVSENKVITKHGLHFYITIKQNLKPLEICLIQSLMDSDYRRECFNFIRIKHRCKNWNVLFNKKFRYNLKSKKLIKVSEEL